MACIKPVTGAATNATVCVKQTTQFAAWSLRFPLQLSPDGLQQLLFYVLNVTAGDDRFLQAAGDVICSYGADAIANATVEFSSAITSVDAVVSLTAEAYALCGFTVSRLLQLLSQAPPESLADAALWHRALATYTKQTLVPFAVRVAPTNQFSSSAVGQQLLAYINSAPTLLLDNIMNRLLLAAWDEAAVATVRQSTNGEAQLPPFGFLRSIPLNQRPSMQAQLPEAIVVEDNSGFVTDTDDDGITEGDNSDYAVATLIAGFGVLLLIVLLFVIYRRRARRKRQELSAYQSPVWAETVGGRGERALEEGSMITSPMAGRASSPRASSPRASSPRSRMSGVDHAVSWRWTKTRSQRDSTTGKPKRGRRSRRSTKRDAEELEETGVGLFPPNAVAGPMSPGLERSTSGRVFMDNPMIRTGARPSMAGRPSTVVANNLAAYRNRTMLSRVRSGSQVGNTGFGLR